MVASAGTHSPPPSTMQSCGGERSQVCDVRDVNTRDASYNESRGERGDRLSSGAGISSYAEAGQCSEG
jgi:hypothetical protein